MLIRRKTEGKYFGDEDHHKKKEKINFLMFSRD